jgi:DNA gyrase/topoisomerase IV subunit A
MARETVAQRNARFDAEREARLVKEVAEYPQRLMTVLARATNAHFELVVNDNKFVVQTRDRYDLKTYAMAYAHSPNSQEQLEDLEWTVERYEQELAEANRLREVKKEALRKVNELFTDEEREQLGL